MSQPGDIAEASERQEKTLEMFAQSFSAKLEEDMGKLHNQFEAFISASRLPLPQVILVLEMLKCEAVEQAFKKYMGN